MKLVGDKSEVVRGKAASYHLICFGIRQKLLFKTRLCDPWFWCPADAVDRAMTAMWPLCKIG